MGLACLDESPPGSTEVANELLQENHVKNHIFFRDVGGHNHLPHSILTVLAMGGGPKELRRAFDDGEKIQRPRPQATAGAVEELGNPEKFRARMGALSEYGNFLAFFEQEIKIQGWRSVVTKFCFSRTPLAEAMLSQLYEGLYHPLIHLGFGIEFDIPSTVAEGLAQAASDDRSGIDIFFQRSEQSVRPGSIQPKPLLELYRSVRASAKIRSASRFQDGPLRCHGLLQRAMDELVTIASQLQVSPDELERNTAEMISCAAFTAAAQKVGKAPKVDFFYMHMVTCSIFLDVLRLQPWIRTEDKVRLLERKARLDLVWYAASGAAEMRTQYLLEYEPVLSRGMDWRAIYRAAIDVHDDGHIVKFIRALKNGEDAVMPFEHSSDAALFPVSGGMWLKIAQICYDSTAETGNENPQELSRKWLWGSGFDLAWAKVPDLMEVQ